MNLVTDKNSEVPSGYQRIQILKFVGQYEPGQIVDADEKEAAQLLSVGQVHDGFSAVDHRRAMLLSEASKLQSMAVDIKKMTQKDMTEMGLKNIVATPLDLSKASVMVEENAKKKESEFAPGFAEESSIDADALAADAEAVEGKSQQSKKSKK